MQDEDSRKNWKVLKEIELETVNYLSPSLLFIKDNSKKLVQVSTVDEKNDTIWLRTQVNIQEGSKRNITYLIKRDKSAIDSDILQCVRRLP